MNVDECKQIKKILFVLVEASQDGCSLICIDFSPQRLRRIKKFVLHCSGCTVVTRCFNQDFVRL